MEKVGEVRDLGGDRMHEPIVRAGGTRAHEQGDTRA